MEKQFKILDIKENRDFRFDIKILLIILTELKPLSINSQQYSFSENDGELFIFLDNPKIRTFFLDNPEGTKILNMENFLEGEPFEIEGGRLLKTYKHDEYLFAIMDKRKSENKN